MGLSFVITQLCIKGGCEICDGCKRGDLCDMVRAVCTIYAYEDELAGTGRGCSFAGMVFFFASAFLSSELDRGTLGDS